jgi:hypothetical protein
VLRGVVGGLDRRDVHLLHDDPDPIPDGDLDVL